MNTTVTKTTMIWFFIVLIVAIVPEGAVGAITQLLRWSDFWSSVC